MLRLLTVFGILLSASASAFAQTTISSCGDVVPPKGRAVVANDITCDSAFPAVVEVGDGGHLDLAGHTLSGGVHGVRCAGRCIIGSTTGTGTIRDARDGITAPRLAKVSNLDFENDGTGILGDFNFAVVRGTQVTMTPTTNGLGIQAKTAHFVGLTVTGGASAVQAQRTVLIGSQITGCSGAAILGGFAKLISTTMTGNTAVDLETLSKPRLINSICDNSRNLANPAQTWGVCAND